MPPKISLRHIGVPRVSVAERLAHLRGLLRRGAFSFEEAVSGADRMTVAVTLFALLELYKLGEAAWEQPESFGEIAVRAPAPAPASRPRRPSAWPADRSGPRMLQGPLRLAPLLASRRAGMGRPETRRATPWPTRSRLRGGDVR